MIKQIEIFTVKKLISKLKKIDPDNDPDDLIEDGHYRLDHYLEVEVEV